MNKKLVYIIVLPIACICFFLGGFGLSSSLRKNNTNNTSTADNTPMSNPQNGEYYVNGTEKISVTKTGKNELVNNVDIIGIYKHEQKNTIISPKTQLQIHAKNNNDVSADVKFEIDYLDADGKIIYYNTRTLLVMPGRDFAIIFDLENKEKVKYESYKLNYSTQRKTTGHITFEEITNKDYSVVRTPNGDIELAFTNNADKDINNATFSCFFYKDGKEIAADTMYASGYSSDGLHPGEGDIATAHMSFFELEYDDYKIVLSQATNYKEENDNWKGDNYE